MAKKKVKTKKPSGLTLKRKNGQFTAGWKIAAKDYGSGQTLQVARGNGWEAISIGKKVTSKAFTVDKSAFYPNTKTVKGKTVDKPKLTKVRFRVRGTQSDTSKINYTASDWSEKVFNLAVPNIPSITPTVGTWPSTAFAWSVTTKEDDSRWYTRVQYQSILVKNSNVTDGSKLDWNKTVTGSTRYSTTSTATSGTVNIQEDSSLIGDGNSYTRWFRIRSQGPAGASAWRYSKHVYANPYAASVTNFTITKGSSKYTAKVWYNTPKSASRPIKEVQIQYAIAVPDEGMACPSGTSWDTAVTALAKDTTGGVSFDIGTTLNLDQCLYLRVNTVYDNATTQGTEVLALAGDLKAPTITSITPNTSGYTVTVVADNTSDVDDSFMVVRYFDDNEPDGFDIAIIPHGSTTATGVQCPQWSGTPRFGIYAAVGEYTAIEREDGVDRYTVKASMMSSVTQRGGSIPFAPENISAAQTEIPGTIRVTWDWSWDEADSAELSWADHPDAWESTDEPSTYTITKLHAAAWNISGLETGKTWYVRVRLISTTGDTVAYGAYSAIHEIDLSSAPLAPVLVLSDSVITEEGELTASWSYSTTDGTSQAFAEIALYDGQDYDHLIDVQTAQYVRISTEDVEWETGETYSFAVRVTSASGHISPWSDPVSVIIADPPTCSISDTSLSTVTTTTTDEGGTTVTDTVTALDEMPLTITVTGAGDSDTTTVVIERADAYHVDRPDETGLNGFEGETIVIMSQVGADPFLITNEDLIGRLDDGAFYRIIATVQDGLGQSAEDTLDFEVHWSHQAEAPTATTSIDADTLAAILTPVAPEGYASGDVCDIYRLSADRPQLIIEGAEFGTTYVDPYPAIGEFGGHRFVTRTANGDYIDEDDSFAWIDTGADEGDLLDIETNVIDFDDGQIEFEYNIDLSHSWNKEFKETKYLGGSVQGDWNKGISRTSSLSVEAAVDEDQELIQAMRRLATSPSICHVRTKDGSSYAADVQVSEKYAQSTAHMIVVFDLKITRIDPEELDGMTLAEWQSIHDEG